MSFLKHLSLSHSVEDLDVPGADRAGGTAPHTVDDDLPLVIVVDDEPTVSVDELLLAVASGDREAFAALKGRMGGLVRANIRRVLRDASRSDAVTGEFFAEVSRDAASFDPDVCSAQGWLLTRAHQRAVDDGAADAPTAGTTRR